MGSVVTFPASRVSAPEHAVWMVTHEQPAGVESIQGVGADVHGRRAAIQDELGEARADGRSGLEAGAGEAAREVEAIGPARPRMGRWSAVVMPS